MVAPPAPWHAEAKQVSVGVASEVVVRESLGAGPPLSRNAATVHSHRGPNTEGGGACGRLQDRFRASLTQKRLALRRRDNDNPPKQETKLASRLNSPFSFSERRCHRGYRLDSVAFCSLSAFDSAASKLQGFYTAGWTRLAAA